MKRTCNGKVLASFGMSPSCINLCVVATILIVGAFLCYADETWATGDIPVKKERLYEDVRILTSIKPARNYKNIASLNKTADHIITEFKKMGCRVSVQTFKGGGQEYKNLECSFGPETGERVIVGAHYDVRDKTPGADDNASGVAGLLEIGRILSELKPDLRQRVDLVAFTLEERRPFGPRNMGSNMYARSLAEAKAKVRAMFSLEMIGYYSDRLGSQGYPLFFFRWYYPTAGNYITVVGKWGQGDLVARVKNLLASVSKTPVESISAPRYLPGIDFSDHQSFWRFGYPAVMITDTAFYRNRNYHESTDTIDTLNFDRMAEVVKGLYWTIINM